MAGSMARRSKRLATPPARPRRESPDADDELVLRARQALEHTALLRARVAAAPPPATLVWGDSAFAEAYDFVPVPYLMLSATGIILQGNESALRLFAAERAALVGRPLIAYLEHECVRNVVRQMLSCPPGVSLTVQGRVRSSGQPKPVQIIVRRSLSRSRGGVAYHVALTDLSEVRKLEEERQQAEAAHRQSVVAERLARAASEAKDDFLAMMSHELRTPLTPILAAADTLIAHGSVPASVREAIEVIRRNVKCEAGLIDDLLDVARISRQSLSVNRLPIDVHHLLAELEQGWTPPLAARGIALQVDAGASGHWVNGDAARLSQVLRNLLGNAAKFTDAGGAVRVTSEDRPDTVRVTVADTGVGIPAETRAGLFSPFLRPRRTSTTRGGLGLGLVICKGIVDAHGGTIEVVSDGPGRGTRVVVDLPTIPWEEASETRRTSQRQGAVPATGTAPTRVLLVEDDADSAEMLSLLLSSEGFVVEVAHSVSAARSAAARCDLIVCDIGLPDGSGLDMVRDLRRQGHHRAIALSGYGSREDVDRSLRAGFSEHLTKPVGLDELVLAVKRLAST
jgi:signal transduction histidine kinase